MKKQRLTLLMPVAAVGLFFLNSYRKIILRLKDENCKKQEFYNVFYKWLKIHHSGRDLKEYFKEHGYYRIAIYGFRELGELLYDELEGNTDISVVCVIDRDKEINYKGIYIYLPEDNLPEADVMVVTALHYYNEIEDAMSEKISCPIISLEDVVYGM